MWRRTAPRAPAVLDPPTVEVLPPRHLGGVRADSMLSLLLLQAHLFLPEGEGGYLKE